MAELSRARTVFLITVLVLLWGGVWPATKIALHYTPPILFGGVRCCLGGLILILYALPRYKKLQLKKFWYIYLISSMLNAVLYYMLQTIGVNYMPSGLFSVLTFIQPVLVGILSWLWLGEDMSKVKFFGFILGFLGVASISVESIFGRISIIGLVLAFATAISWAFGTVYTKRVVARVDALWLAAIQFFVGGLAITLVGSATESWTTIAWSNLQFLLCLAYGTVLGVSVGWVIYFTLVRSIDASRVASYTFLIPLIAVCIGTMFLHEQFTAYLLAGIVLIVLSIYLVNRKTLKTVALGELQ